jgi:hypothetical protein
VTETPERSEQLPEEAPTEQVHDDAGGSGADHSPGVPGEEGTATGNPDAAGAEGEGARGAEGEGARAAKGEGDRTDEGERARADEEGDAKDEEGGRADEEGLAGA